MIDPRRISNGPCKDRLKDKVALITGAGGGQGRVVSLLFAEAGATVFASDINAETLAGTQELADQKGLAITTTVVDASSAEQTQAWAEQAIAKAGSIDILYNNGANVFMAPFAEMTAEQWHETIRLELDVIFMPTKAVWPYMVKQDGGSIINISSGAGMRALEGVGAAAHAAGKGGVIAVTHQLAFEGAPHWIRVNCISPGPIMGPTLQAAYDSMEEFRNLFDSGPMMERHGLPDDIAYTGLFLASDESQFITGINISVDGGAAGKIGAVVGRLHKRA